MAKPDVAILAAIHTLTTERGIPPTYREIGAHLNLAHSAVHGIIRRLSTDGLVLEEPRSARTVRLSPLGKEAILAIDEAQSSS